MKKPLLFGIILTVCIVSVAFVFAQVYPVGMISYWKFDEGSGSIAIDSVNGNNGTIYGANWTTGIVDGALSFDRVGDCEVGDPANLNITDKLTLEAWINPHDLEENNIISKQGECTPYQLFIDLGGIQFHFSFDNTVWYGIFSGYGETPASGIIDTDEWQHIALTFDSGTMKVYYNGELKTTESGPSELPSCQSSVFFNWFNGSIDEAAIYNRALTACEINQHYNNGLAGKGYTLEDSIETLIINVEDLDLPKGIEKSLTSKLAVALDSLERGRDNAVKKQLEAFIHTVEALRGKKLTDDQAGALITAVQCIIDNI